MLGEDLVRHPRRIGVEILEIEQFGRPWVHDFIAAQASGRGIGVLIADQCPHALFVRQRSQA